MTSTLLSRSIPYRLARLWAWKFSLCSLALLMVSGCADPLFESATTNSVNTPLVAGNQESDKPQAPLGKQDKSKKKGEKMEVATFGAGCFWCVEAVFQQLKGVKKVQSGYMGGHVPNPTYEQVCSGTTGHAEVIQIQFDPDVISFDELLEVFWKTHDPTTLNRQGADTGTQYRSAVFYHSEKQKTTAAGYKKKLNEAKAFPNPVVTEVSPAAKFYVAENYHQNYFNNNQGNPYCRAVIPPKLEKLKKVFGDKLKKK